jgi:hypothetical protein
MRRPSDATRERLNEIADELAVIAAAAYAPSERDYAAALAAEARRIERACCRDQVAASAVIERRPITPYSPRPR